MRKAGDGDLTLGQGVDPGQQLREGRLSGAVSAADAKHATGVSLEIDPVERLHAGIVLLHPHGAESHLPLLR